VSLTSEVALGIGAALSAVGAVCGYVFTGDIITLQDKFQRKEKEAWEKSGKKGEEPTGDQALTKAESRQKWWHRPIAVILVLAVIANIVAVVCA
jgi:hypothetical protein